jgi:hypothetical protein
VRFTGINLFGAYDALIPMVRIATGVALSVRRDAACVGLLRRVQHSSSLSEHALGRVRGCPQAALSNMQTVRNQD